MGRVVFGTNNGIVSSGSFINITNVQTDTYRNFLNNISLSGYSLPPKATQEFSNTEIIKLEKFGFTDFINIPQINDGDEIFSIVGPNMFVSGGENGSRFDEHGRLIHSLPNNRPRYTFNPLSGIYEGVWIENDETNSFLFSEDFINSYWLSIRMHDIVQSDFPSPHISNISFKLIPNTENASHQFYRNINYLTGVYNFSVFAKRDGYNFLGLRLPSPFSANAWFNLLTGEIGTVNQIYTPYMIPCKNDWYRCGVLFNVSSDLGGINTIIQLSNQDNTQSFPGNNVDGISIYGAMVNRTSINSYILNDGVIETRISEQLLSSGAINTSENYTIYKNRIRNEQEELVAEFYDVGESEKTTYINGVLVGTESTTISEDITIDSDQSDKYKCIAVRQGNITESELIGITTL